MDGINRADDSREGSTSTESDSDTRGDSSQYSSGGTNEHSSAKRKRQ